jgi:inorganic pyrophosphatase
MEMIDDGEKDTKLLAVDLNDEKLKDYSNLKDVSKKDLKQIQYFFQTYKRFRNELVIVKQFKDVN